MDHFETDISHRYALLDTPDGARLAATIFEAANAASGTLLVVPAVAVPQGFYARLARFAARDGLRVVTFDYRGFGKSRRSPGPRATLTRWGEVDYPAVLRWVFDHFDGAPVYVLGHSLGGQYLGMAPDAGRIAGAATVASMSGTIANLERDRRRVEMLFRYAVPAFTAALPEVPGWLGLGQAMPSAAMRQWARWCLSPDYFLSEHPEYVQRVQRYGGPLTMLSFTDDHLAPLANVEWLVRFYRHAKPRHVHLDPSRVGLTRIGHMGFFRGSSQPLWGCLLGQLRRHDPHFAPFPTRRAEADLRELVQADLDHGVA